MQANNSTIEAPITVESLLGIAEAMSNMSERLEAIETIILTARAQISPFTLGMTPVLYPDPQRETQIMLRSEQCFGRGHVVTELDVIDARNSFSRLDGQSLPLPAQPTESVDLSVARLVESCPKCGGKVQTLGREACCCLDCDWDNLTELQAPVTEDVGTTKASCLYSSMAEWEANQQRSLLEEDFSAVHHWPVPPGA